jgi:two-component system response regulator HupR/HoxA
MNAIDLPTVLLVDDEVRSQEAMRRTLDEDFRILTAGDAEQARALLEQHPVAVILCDQRMPGLTGVAFLKEVRERWPDTVRIVISGYTDSEDIITGINDAGIYQYILKPWVPDHLLDTVRQAAEGRQLQGNLRRLDIDLRAGTGVLRARTQAQLARVKDSFDFGRIEHTPGSPVAEVCRMAAKVARYDLSVLVHGESGTGKELLARAVHYASARAGGPFVVENCAAIPDTLIESELYGHKRGAFTGAYDDHIGLFQRADKGTIFLDEIGETSPAFQVKLLRVLQEGEVRPVGAPKPVAVDVRVIAATHRDLEADVRSGRFREDLYYRLANVTLTMPPLRERGQDVTLIAQRVLDDVATHLGHGHLRFTADALAALQAFPWPGNIRELHNEVTRAVALSEPQPGSDGCGLIGAHAFSRKVLQGGHGRTVPGDDALGLHLDIPQSGTLQERLDRIEAAVLRETLLRLRWNKTHAARELGLSRVGLRAKLQRFGLEPKLDGQADALADAPDAADTRPGETA